MLNVNADGDLRGAKPVGSIGARYVLFVSIDRSTGASEYDRNDSCREKFGTDGACEIGSGAGCTTSGTAETSVGATEEPLTLTSMTGTMCPLGST